MTSGFSTWHRLCYSTYRHIAEIPVELAKNNLWKRIIKNAVANIVVVIIAVIHSNQKWLGNAAYLGVVATVFAHPGRRFGQMAEANILLLIGTLVGVGWAVLGLYLSSLVVEENASAAFAIKGLFFTAIAMVHGFMRSKFPKLFLGVLLMVFVATVILASTSKTVTRKGVTLILYPVFVGVASILVVNLLVFPEFSSSFLGQVTIETINDTEQALEKAGQYFISRKLEDEQSAKTGEWDKAVRKPESAHDQTGKSVSHRRRGLSATIRDGARGRSVTLEKKSHNAEQQKPKMPTIKEVTAAKTKIRGKLRSCKAAQQECNFELFIGVLPPYELKPISSRSMKRLIANTACIISACESKFALLGDEEESRIVKEEPDDDACASSDETKRETSRRKASRYNLSSILPTSMDGEKSDEDELEIIKPKREIEYGDEGLLKYLIAAISQPYTELFAHLDETFSIIKKSIAYVYGVTHLPKDQERPKRMALEDIETALMDLQTALSRFDSTFAHALEKTNAMDHLQSKDPDIMPRDEVFLVCSFMLNVRQASTHVEDMLKHARELVMSYNDRYGRRRLYFPQIKWSKWLFSGGAEDEALPKEGRKVNRSGNPKEWTKIKDASSPANVALLAGRTDMEQNILSLQPDRTSNGQSAKMKDKAAAELPSLSAVFRARAADSLEWIQDSEDLTYALKLTVAIMLVLWPAFVPSWNQWYQLNRGLWAALQLIFVLEVSIGTSVLQFIIRIIGVTLGCLWGWASVTARHKNPIVCAVMVFIGQFPFIYVQLATKYPKGGAVAIVSVTVVALASIQETVPGTPTENFLKRYIAFLIGGTVALAVEVCLLPVKARTRMIESISSALAALTEMEKCIAVGIDSAEMLDIVASGRQKRFERETAKANAALSAAETFLPLTATEPRLKPSTLHHPHRDKLLFTELLYLLHQIVDRMENMLALRSGYGSGPLEDFNPKLYPYRRNVAGAIVLSLYAVREALVTKTALPQFMPSARVAHTRLVNRVREVGSTGMREDHGPSEGKENGEERDPKPMSAGASNAALRRRKYLAWNATSAAQAEIIEFLEEVMELAKLLVGANEFRSGLFVRTGPHGTPQNSKADKISANCDSGRRSDDRGQDDDEHDGFGDEEDVEKGLRRRFGRRRRRTTLMSMAAEEEEQELPASLVRIQTRKREEVGRRRAASGTATVSTAAFGEHDKGR